MDEGQQKHQKVYSFLKRVLSQERYERLRAIEPCVIVANGFNKAFKFVILGDDRLYITENPPKLAKDVRIVIELSTVTSIQIVSMLFVCHIAIACQHLRSSLVLRAAHHTTRKNSLTFVIFIYFLVLVAFKTF